MISADEGLVRPRLPYIDLNNGRLDFKKVEQYLPRQHGLL